jgi:hypothetical protein
MRHHVHWLKFNVSDKSAAIILWVLLQAQDGDSKYPTNGIFLPDCIASHLIKQCSLPQEPQASQLS